MLLTVIAISSFFLLSSAQTDPDCTTAYANVFNSTNTTVCAKAYNAVISGNYTNEQRMMVCNETQNCSMMLENIVSTCGSMIEYPTRITQDLLCITNSNGSSCASTYAVMFIYTEDNIFKTIDTNCSGFYCSQACNETLREVNSYFGCCFGEIVQGLYENGTFTHAEATLYTDAYPGICGLYDFPLCNGSTIPPSACSDATVTFFETNDTCSRAVQYLLSRKTEQLPYIFEASCATRFRDYVTVCSDIFDDDELQNLADIAVAISQQTNRNGTSCSEFISTFFDEGDDDDDEDPCIRDYLLRQCSYNCTKLLTNVTEEFGCCFNTIVAQLNSLSDDVSDQIETIILTREIYDLCEIESHGVCNGTTISYTNAAEQCVTAGNTFFANDTCIDYYRTLGDYSESTAVELNSAATAICTNNTCLGRWYSYINYLRTCRVGGGDDDDDDDSDDYDDDDSYLDFVYLTGNTTCREDNNDNSCYASIFTNPVYVMVTEALGEGGICYDGCPSECNQLIMGAFGSVGCCLGEYGRALAGEEVVQAVSTACNIPGLTNRCSEIQPSGGGGGGVTPGTPGTPDGASIQKTFGVLIFLLGITAIAFS